MFTATMGAASVLASVLGACDDSGSEEAPWIQPPPPPPPGPCFVHQSPEPLCAWSARDAGTSDAHAHVEPGDADVDAAPIEPADGGAPEGGAVVGEVVPDVSENTCLVSRDLSLECSSHVAGIDVAADGDATELFITQAGVDITTSQRSTEPDGRAYVERVRVGADGKINYAAAPFEPFLREQPSTRAPAGALVLVPSSASSPAHVALFEAGSERASTVRFAPLGEKLDAPVSFGAPVPLPVAVSYRPALFRGTSGDILFLGEPRGGEFHAPTREPFVLLSGLPNAPVTTTTTVPTGAYEFAVTTTPSGEPAGLFIRDQRLFLHEGPALERERWSRAFENGVNVPHLDLAYVARGDTHVPVVLARRGDTDPTTVRFVEEGVETVGASLGGSYSTCSRSTYIGITCDACPESEQCEAGQDRIGEARLVTVGERVFAVFESTDVRRIMGFKRSAVPIIDVGCVCSLVERGKEERADSLVVVEIVPNPDARQAPRVVERMRVELSPARKTGFVSILPRGDGEVDVIVGPALAGFGSHPTKPPPRIVYRVLRLDLAARP